MASNYSPQGCRIDLFVILNFPVQKKISSGYERGRRRKWKRGTRRKEEKLGKNMKREGKKGGKGLGGEKKGKGKVIYDLEIIKNLP